MSSQTADTNCAVNEFADAELRDLRRTTRLVELAHFLAQHPTAALPEACVNHASLKAAYRFFANDDIAPQDMLSSHIEATYSLSCQGPVGLRGIRYHRSLLYRAPCDHSLLPLRHTPVRSALP